MQEALILFLRKIFQLYIYNIAGKKSKLIPLQGIHKQ